MKLRPEIKTFCDAAETLLSPVLMQKPLTEEERSLIKMYMKSLETVILTGTASTKPAQLIF